MKAVPPPLSGNYIPLSDPTDLDESQMTYGPKQTYTSDSKPKTSDLDSCESNSSVESLESMPKPVIIEPKLEDSPKIKQIRDQDHDYILKLTNADLLRNLKLTKSNSSLGEIVHIPAEVRFSLPGLLESPGLMESIKRHSE
ncbi:hypothetical protein Tco_1229497 [Tanacetum coccineum]